MPALRVKVRAALIRLLPLTGRPKESKSVFEPDRVIPLSSVVLKACPLAGSMTGLLLHGGLADAVTQLTE